MLAISERNLHEVDITSGEFKANPFDFYARLREEAPVFRTTIGGKIPVWLVTRYEDVKSVLMDERFAKDKRNVKAKTALDVTWMPGFIRAMENNMLDMDAPDHTRLRNLVHKAFTPRRIQEMQSRIESLSHETLAKAKSKGQFDLVEDYALPIPATVIAEILGVPASDMTRFHRWTSSLLQSNAASTIGAMKMIPTMWQLFRYVKGQLENRRKHPKDDMLTALIEAEENGDSLSTDEAIAMVVILLIAGHETTVNLIASGTLALLENPKELELLRSDVSLMPSAVEEILRYTVPVETATERYAKEPITMHGVTIPAGGLTLAALASANRDESVFENPDTLDISRSPNRHFSFGHGIHYCLGAPLARMEGAIALDTLIHELPDLSLAVHPETLKWRNGMVIRGLDKLPVRV